MRRPLAIILTLLLASPLHLCAAEPLRNRREFITALNKIQEGMPEAEVRKLLGPPDDIRTHDDGEISWVNTREVWRYGTSGHLTTATLGEVVIGTQQQALHVIGNGETLPEGMLEESQLRLLMEALGQIPQDGNYNPRTVIRAVNLLQPLGKEKALAVIEEFAHRCGDRAADSVDYVMRVLFEVPPDPGYFPEMGMWIFRFDPAWKKRFPRYPLVIIDDIPLLVGHRAGSSGPGLDPAQLVPYFRQHGVLRSKPLSPPNHPFQAIASPEKFPESCYDRKTEKWNISKQSSLQAQIFALLETVYQIEEADANEPPATGLKGTKTRIDEASKVPIRWDPKLNQYTFLDGKSYPLPYVSRYHPLVWKIPASGAQVKLILERRTRHSLEISQAIAYPPNAKVTGRVFNVKTPDKTIDDFVFEPEEGFDGSGSWGQSMDAHVEDGEQLQAEVTVNGKKYLSPVFKP